MNELVQFIDNCEGIVIKQSSRQIPLWPTAIINAGEIGLVLSVEYYHEIGTLCEILIGSEIFFDVPRSKFQII